jgi:hypothetical protein
MTSNFPKHIIRDAIDRADAVFDSHDIIHVLGHENQRLYVRALAEILGERPFQALHSQFGIAIKEICVELGYTGVSSRSLDIFGQNSECVRWTKR